MLLLSEKSLVQVLEKFMWTDLSIVFGEYGLGTG